MSSVSILYTCMLTHVGNVESKRLKRPLDNSQNLVGRDKRERASPVNERREYELESVKVSMPLVLARRVPWL